eukprot:NODE_3341_length_799_cov_157.081989.p4 GENE.NODE_3341_length_799_cov_157.081989~~NODE_3341_length_799_cov_157.081989.p4  ORF type:complete len:102 (+),score=33.12 NODE_3341_length_799_cov_157.081989:212-517(+)
MLADVATGGETASASFGRRIGSQRGTETDDQPSMGGGATRGARIGDDGRDLGAGESSGGDGKVAVDPHDSGVAGSGGGWNAHWTGGAAIGGDGGGITSRGP